jgi:hypothetical protein
MSSLIPCSSCQRHLRTEDVVCPFCAAPVLPRAALPVRGVIPRDTKRSALFAMGVGLAASACSADNSVAIYGAPAPPLSQGGGSGAGGNGGGSGGGGGNGNGGTNAVPVYGAPVPPLGGSGGDGGSNGGGTGGIIDAGTLDAGETDAAAAVDGGGDAEP